MLTEIGGLVIVINRNCTKCGQLKAAEEFKMKKRGLYGRASWCKECESVYNRIRYDSIKTNPLKCNELIERGRKWRKNNPEKDRTRAKRNKLKIRSTPEGILNDRVSNLMRSSLKSGKGGSRWELLVGYTVKELKSHLENHFLPGMSWENISKWHIDHIIPRSAFNYQTPDDIDFKRCWALNNLRPLWAIDNQKKKGKVDRPFQPSLSIAV